MEAILNEAALAQWKGSQTPEETIIKQLKSASATAGTQNKFTYTAEFKKDLSTWLSSQFTASSSPALRCAILELVRIIARDESGVNALLSDTLTKCVLDASGLPAICEAERTPEERLEAIKCLINALHRSDRCRGLFMEKGGDSGLVSALDAIDREGPETRYLLVRLAFLVAATIPKLQRTWRADPVVTRALCRIAASFASDERSADEALKTLFPLYRCCIDDAKNIELSAIDSENLKTCVLLIRNVPKGSEILQNTIHLVACLTLDVDIVCPKVEDDSPLSYGGRAMGVPQIVMDDLSDRLAVTTEPEALELLGTSMNFLNTLCAVCKEARRFCRLKILPPLKAAEVERPPEQGDTMRNRLVRVMQSNSRVRTIAAELAFVLCKRSVNRLIKYTGFGHSAGLLANSGLLGRINEGRRASDSEDSETDDYVEVEDQVNPVTGYIRPDGPKIEMSEAQREYEAQKLIESMDKLLESGVIKPSVIGPDGRPRPVSHVLEMAANVRTPPGSDSDSD